MSNFSTKINGHRVLVSFSTNRENQAQALTEIGDYIADFLARQPGFIRSTLLASDDGEQVVHYAEWTDEAAFVAIGPLARQHPDFNKLMAYQPKGTGFWEVRRFEPA